jgi:hypothetical protein
MGKRRCHSFLATRQVNDKSMYKCLEPIVQYREPIHTTDLFGGVNSPSGSELGQRYSFAGKDEERTVPMNVSEPLAPDWQIPSHK